MPIKRIPAIPQWFDAYISSLPDYKVDELMSWVTGAQARVVCIEHTRTPVVYDAGQELYDKLRELAGISERRIAKEARKLQYNAKYTYAKPVTAATPKRSTRGGRGRRRR